MSYARFKYKLSVINDLVDRATLLTTSVTVNLINNTMEERKYLLFQNVDKTTLSNGHLVSFSSLDIGFK